jgi:uncharacterized membrane protein YgcG
VRIKIGDPDRFLSGEQTYRIEYVADGALYFRESLDELYWNVTGNGWDVPIASARVRVQLPAATEPLQTACYAGPAGDTGACARTQRAADGTAVFSHESLPPGSGLSIAIGFPKGAVQEPGFAAVLWRYITAYSYVAFFLALPFIAIAVMGVWWWKRGRDPRGRGTIITQFDPPERLSAPEVGVIEDQFARQREFTAGIIVLAVNGYIRIHRVDDTHLWVFSSTDYILERILDTVPEDPFERQLLEELFAGKFIGTHTTLSGDVEGVALSDLKERFTDAAKRLKKKLYKQVTEKGYFLSNPRTLRHMYSAAGFGIATAAALVLSFMSVPKVAIFSGMAVGIIVFAFGFIMPARTKKGVRAREHIAGFERYIKVAETDRLAFHNAPERTPERFDALLPYAIALGLERDWAAIFADMDMQQPAWFAGGAHVTFNVSEFSSELSSSFSSAVSSGAASAGGGSAGGGAGGGGGGSW